jgi:hypothetical protein
MGMLHHEASAASSAGMEAAPVPAIGHFEKVWALPQYRPGILIAMAVLLYSCPYLAVTVLNPRLTELYKSVAPQIEENSLFARPADSWLTPFLGLQRVCFDSQWCHLTEGLHTLFTFAVLFIGLSSVLRNTVLPVCGVFEGNPRFQLARCALTSLLALAYCWILHGPRILFLIGALLVNYALTRTLRRWRLLPVLIVTFNMWLMIHSVTHEGYRLSTVLEGIVDTLRLPIESFYGPLEFTDWLENPSHDWGGTIAWQAPPPPLPPCPLTPCGLGPVSSPPSDPPPWEMLYNLVLLRVVSWSLDSWMAAQQDPVDPDPSSVPVTPTPNPNYPPPHQHPCQSEAPPQPPCPSDPASQEAEAKRIVRASRPEAEYCSVLLLWAYVTYPPTFISGPTQTFNAFAHYMAHPQRGVGLGGKVRYTLLRTLVPFLMLEVWMHGLQP